MFKFISYDAALVPAEGQEVVSSLAAPVKHIGKDAAGQAFHLFALKQAGLYGAQNSLLSLLVASTAWLQGSKDDVVEHGSTANSATPCLAQGSLCFSCHTSAHC